ncbi:hypothetical protein BRD17_00285 [Halobacteriales archaeon SW_7_68_16]|nr:MAG: hypothetical protein BRD17_00285 [Halobacteriales archaeon SW_7_68_16]
MVYVTRGLLEALLDMAADAEPEALTSGLVVSSAGELTADDPGTPTDLADDAPVFTDFYMPDVSGSLTSVFGVDLGVPVGQTQGRFVTHPRGDLSVSREDDLHGIVFVAVPPWTVDDVAAFDRSGTRQDLVIVDAAPPEERFD